VIPALRDAVLDALAVLLPVDCAGCGLADRSLCSDCRRAVRPAVIRAALVDGTPLYSGLAYRGRARRILLAFKQEGRTGLAGVLAVALAASVRAAVTEATVGDLELCVVPSSRSARRRRGYDPVRMLLARSGLRGAPVFAPARPHRAQKSLSVVDRLSNLDGVFRLRRPVAGRRFVLIDDVVTSGATLLEAARVLRDGGAEVLAAATAATTPRRIGGGRRHSVRVP
jgi:ComF family protein